MTKLRYPSKWNRHLAELVCNQMLKGIHRKFPDITSEQREAFYSRFGFLAELFCLHLPRASAALGAVICKCTIKYGLPKPVALAETLRKGTFNGDKDPAKLLWDYITKTIGRKEDSTLIYSKCVTAARAYCEDRTLTELRYATTDIFEWDEDFRYPATKNKPVEAKTEPAVEPVVVHLNAGRRGLIEKEIVTKSFYTPAEVAECTGYRIYTIRDACNTGRIRASKVESNSLGNNYKWEISHEEMLKVKKYGLPKPTPEQRKFRPQKANQKESFTESNSSNGKPHQSP